MVGDMFKTKLKAKIERDPMTGIREREIALVRPPGSLEASRGILRRMPAGARS